MASCLLLVQILSVLQSVYLTNMLVSSVTSKDGPVWEVEKRERFKMYAGLACWPHKDAAVMLGCCTAQRAVQWSLLTKMQQWTRLVSSLGSSCEGMCAMQSAAVNVAALSPWRGLDTDSGRL